MSERIYFGTIKEGIEPPNLIEVQLNSYLDFLQKDVPFSKRKISGLQAVFKEVFPIESYDEKADPRFQPLRDRRTETDCARVPAGKPDLQRAVARHFPAPRGKGDEGRKSLHGRNPAHDAAGHVRHQRRGARHRQPVASFAGHRVRIEHPSQRQGALQFPHHSGSRFLDRSAVRHERPALHLSRSPQTPPEISRDHFPPRARLWLGRGSDQTVLHDRDAQTERKAR